MQQITIVVNDLHRVAALDGEIHWFEGTPDLRDDVLAGGSRRPSGTADERQEGGQSHDSIGCRIADQVVQAHIGSQAAQGTALAWLFPTSDRVASPS